MQKESKTEKRMTVDEVNRIRRASYIKMTAMVGFVTAVLAFGSIAWFTMSREVEGSGVQMMSSDQPFELKTVGYYGYFDDWITDTELLKIAQNRANAAVPPSGTSGTLITGNKTSIQWLVGENYNTRNYVTTSTSEEEKGIRPGTSGEMKFWIVPKDIETINIQFKLEILPYKTVYETDASGAYVYSAGEDVPNENGVELISDNPDYITYLKNHVMFFKTREEVKKGDGTFSHYVYSDMIPLDENFNLVKKTIEGNDVYTNVLTFELNGNQELVEHPFSVYWVWPETLAEAALSESYFYNISGHALFQNDEVFNKLKQNPTFFLKDYQTDDVGNQTITRDVIYKHYSKLSLEYNYADQEIGDNVNYFLLSLSAIG